MQDKEKKGQPYHVHVKIQIFKEEPVLGPGIVQLLEYLEKTGSMKEACGQMGMSYSKGWKIINRAEKGLGYSLISRHHGGKAGGSCMLTEESLQLIRKFRRVEQEVNEYTQTICKNILGEM